MREIVIRFDSKSWNESESLIKFIFNTQEQEWFLSTSNRAICYNLDSVSYDDAREYYLFSS